MLQSIPSPSISYFEIGPFRVYFYALFILTGIIVAIALTSRRLTARGGRPGLVTDLALWAIPFGILGGRLYHVVTHPRDYFYPGADLWRVLFIWEGGLAIFGSFLFGAIGFYIGCRRAGVRFLSFADAAAPGILIAQAIGRLGNYFNQELFGAPTTLPWGLAIDAGNAAMPPGTAADTLFQPLFLYEMIWSLAGAAFILIIETKVPLRWGRAIAAYFIIYGTGRAWLEMLRLDPTELTVFGIKINIIMAVAFALAGITILFIQRRRPPTEPDPYLPSPGPREALKSQR